MELILIYMLLLGFALNGLIFIGMLHRQSLLERQLKLAIKQLNVIAISKGLR